MFLICTVAYYGRHSFYDKKHQAHSLPSLSHLQDQQIECWLYSISSSRLQINLGTNWCQSITNYVDIENVLLKSSAVGYIDDFIAIAQPEGCFLLTTIFTACMACLTDVYRRGVRVHSLPGSAGDHHRRLLVDDLGKESGHRRHAGELF